ncbi:MAG TPA: glycosyltransferase, partial [Chthoniobacterales bacterium]
MLPLSGHLLRSDFVRVLAPKFPGARVAVVGVEKGEIEAQSAHTQLSIGSFESVAELDEVLAGNGGAQARFDAVVWIYPRSGANDEQDAAVVAGASDEIVLLPGRGAEAAKRRPALVEHFRTFGFVPDYDADLSELDSAAVSLVRRDQQDGETSVAAVETAFARLNERMRGLEKTLSTRMAELEAADRHIAKLEEKVLALKEAKKQLKQLKQEKQALRKSPERKVGQVILAPYLLPQKLFREVSKRIAPAPARWHAKPQSASEYQAWLARHSATADDLTRMRAEARGFSYAPLISIITPVFNTPASWLAAAIDSVIAQVYQNWELILIDDGSSDAGTIAALPTL